MLSHFSPVWFFGYDVVLELAFALITLFAAIFAFRIYRKTSHIYVRLFGISFIFISISYFIQSAFNMLMISEERSAISNLILDTLGAYAHIIFMTIGLSILAYMTFKAENRKILWMLILIALTSILLSGNIFYQFFLVSSIYLAFIALHFIQNFLKCRDRRSLLTAVAFVFLLFGSIHFIISVNHQLFYAIGHILELFAYLFILWNFYLVLKK